MTSMSASARIEVAVDIPSDEVGEKLPLLLRMLPDGVESRLVSSEGGASLRITLVGKFADVRNTVDAIADRLGID
jgi:hypothetical protein